ncbi:MAG: chlorophyllase [Dactylosporangium sp.]|nr:chlorophyllase [Dactylosporangium sp.]
MASPDGHRAEAGTPTHGSTVAPASEGPAASAPPQLPPLPSRPSPTKPLAVGVRELNLSRGPDRPLPTTVWYPAGGAAGDGTRSGATPAIGRFPLVILSHGLTGLPQALAPIGIRWAAAGFIVAAPAYPHTKHDAPHFDISDVVNQPADASYVINEVLALDGDAGDPFAGHVDTAAIAATGHSAGGYTTTGMLSTQRDPRLRAAIVIAGALLGGAYTGPATPVLFVHGDADPTVSYRGGRAAYKAVPWPKAFLTLVGGDHGRYLATDGVGFEQTIRTTTDFLRWTLYGDTGAKGRLSRDGTSVATSRWESRL